MAQVSVEVPAVVARALRETALLLYQATVEALRLALHARDERPESLREIEEHRARLAEVDALLAQLRWSPPPAERKLELSSPRELLRDALHGALIDAGERLALARTADSERDAGEEAAEQVIALDRLVRELEGGQHS